jgi:RNA polymerase sigma factor for flagellar operon FliA
MQAVPEFIQEHENMVHGLAVRLRRELALHGEVDDLVAFGFGGLLEARRRFDPGRGVRFRTFAYYRVRGAMLDGVRKMAYLPRRAHERLRESSACAAPTAKPVGSLSGLDKVFARVSASLTTAVPLHGSFGQDSPEQALLKQESVTRLLQALSTLPDRKRAVLRGHYFEGRSLEAVARDLGISRSWASRLHTAALAELRRALEA